MKNIDNQKTCEPHPSGSHLPPFVRLLRFVREVWQSPYDLEPTREAHRKASERYDKAVATYYRCEEEQVNSFLAHNEASYAKGQRDALNALLHPMPNATSPSVGANEKPKTP